MDEGARFRAFVDSTSRQDRDWSAFREFERAVNEVVRAASMVPAHSGEGAAIREQAVLRIPVTAMLFRALPRVGLGTILTNVNGLGYAIRYGLLALSPTALDFVAGPEALESLAERGCRAERSAAPRPPHAPLA